MENETNEYFLKAGLDVPGSDTVFKDPLVKRIADDILAQEGISLSDLRVRKLYHVRVRGVERESVAIPRELVILDEGEDELYPGRKKIRMSFFLRRGSYATIIIKRLFLGSEEGRIR